MSKTNASHVLIKYHPLEVSLFTGRLSCPGTMCYIQRHGMCSLKHFTHMSSHLFYGVFQRTPFVTEAQPEIRDIAVYASHNQNVRICGVLEI